jgi:hypothetical protein
MMTKNREFYDFIGEFLPNEMVDIIYSYEITKYDDYYDNYSWEDVQTMLDDVVFHGPSMCNHLFKIFETIDTSFYPNIDDEVTISPSRLNPEYVIQGSSFELDDWFIVDYFKRPGGGKKYYYDDDCTNYENMTLMMITILKKFDSWFWEHYIGSKNDDEELKKIIDIYDILDKYSYMNEDEVDNSSIENVDDNL